MFLFILYKIHGLYTHIHKAYIYSLNEPPIFGAYMTKTSVFAFLFNDNMVKCLKCILTYLTYIKVFILLQLIHEQSRE